MKMTKNILLLFLCLVFVASAVEAKIVKDSLYQIPKTSIAPVIDGVQDAVWKTLDWNMQRIYNVGDPPTATSGADSGQGLTGMSKAMWDATNFYLLFYNVDDVLVDKPASAAYQQDAVEFYIDGDNSKILDGVSPDPGGGLAPEDHQFTIDHWMKGTEAGRLGTVFGATFDTAGVEFKIADVEDTEGFPGWMLEVKIPLGSLGIDGSSADNLLIGWELQQDESDDAAGDRTSMSKWWSSSNNSWTNAAIWGTAVLSDRVVDSTLVIVKTNAAITVDGVMDAAYTVANPVTTNLFRVDAAGDITDPMFGGFVTAYPLWDDNNYYVFFDVVDAVITEIPANPNYNQDAVEFYIDPTNRKQQDGVSPDPGGGLAPGDFQLTIPHLYKDTEVGRLVQIGFPATTDTAGFAFKIADKAEGGYYVELKMKMTGLSIDAVEGQEIGFEVQQDNASTATAGRTGMEKWWSASNNSWTDASIWGTAVLGSLVSQGVRSNNPSVASEYRLEQNYPNPFNPSTHITYSVPKSQKVRLAVYDLLGNQVAMLVNETKGAGTYTVNFNAQNLSSGVYFYKLETGNTLLVKKMMLLK